MLSFNWPHTSQAMQYKYSPWIEGVRRRRSRYRMFICLESVLTAPINFTVQFVVAPCILNKRKYFAIIAKSIWHHTQHYKSINNKLPLIHEFGFRRLFLQLTHTLTHNGGLETLDPYTFCLFDLLILCHWRQVKVIYSFKYFRSLKQEQFILGINISIGKKRHVLAFLGNFLGTQFIGQDILFINCSVVVLFLLKIKRTRCSCVTRRSLQWCLQCKFHDW